MSPATQSRKHQCAECQTGFHAESARNQHFQEKHLPKATQATTRTNKSLSPTSIDYLYHRDIKYSSLSAAEQDVIRNRLSDLCHSEERLRKEGYNLPISSVVQNESLPTPRVDLPCPETNSSAPKTAAIVLDCEMAGTVGGENELVQLTMIDFLSGRVLQSCLVNPSRPIVDWREEITGINAASMQEAVAANKVLHGWEAARAEFWRFADKETIIIGQSVHNDLKVLRICHLRIIDSAIVTAEAVLGTNSKIRKRWGLEALCNGLLGIHIRKPSQTGGREVHDALEDALATREVVLLCAREPNKLKRWADAARSAFYNGNRSKRLRSRTGSSQPKKLSRGKCVVKEDVNEYGGMLRWEDVVDWEIWPKSPPDSD